MRYLLVQLPIPRLNYGMRTGNIPLGAACLKQAVGDLPVSVTIMPESIATYLGDGALFSWIAAQKPDAVGFTLFCWNVDRAQALAVRLQHALGCRIFFGGPEVTRGNPRLKEGIADLLMEGEGEAAFRALVTDPDLWNSGWLSMDAQDLFVHSESPYPDGDLEPEIEDMILLETQRGCPYRCGYCFYNKARKKLCFRPITPLLNGIRWARKRGLSEVFLLDPTLDARKDLPLFLEEIISENQNPQLEIQSEIRAEGITPALAAAFAAAGFVGFEIGLQSTNPKALAVMRRPTDLDAFLKGVFHLKAAGILPRIDLIAGLPGDTLEGFLRSVDFVVENGLAEDVQVFPLSVLPGTDFRMRAEELGLVFAEDPPYTIRSTPTFSEADLHLALAMAEERLETVLYPFPEVDASYRKGGFREKEIWEDTKVTLGKKEWIAKLVIKEKRPFDAILGMGERLTQPYQLLLPPGSIDEDRLCAIVAGLTAENPHTPFEIVFYEPKTLPDTARILAACQIPRPHFLDGDLRFLYPAAGNRTVMMTLVSSRWETLLPDWREPMHRQVFWWQKKELPTQKELLAYEDLDAILVDSPGADILRWQEEMAQDADLLPFLSFAGMEDNLHWIELTAGDSYWTGAFSGSRS